MSRRLLVNNFLLGLLLLPPPVLALGFNYSGSALLDLSTLKFSGIGVTVSPFFQYQSASVSDILPGVCCGGVTVDSTVFDRSGWADRSLSAQLPSVGFSVTTANSSILHTTATFIGDGGLNSQLWRRGLIVANETGDLTVSVRYAMTNSGVPSPVREGWGVTTAASLNLHDLSDIRFRLNSQVGLETGTLSLTHRFTQGELSVLDLSTQVTAGVPSPDMLWPTLAGMVAIALFLRHREKSAKRA